MLFQSLKSIVTNIPDKYLLLFIIAIGLLLRTINLTIGFPILYASGDEAVYHLSALNMLASKTLFTLGNYGPLGAYLQIPFIALASFVLFITGKIHSISDLEFLIVTHEGYFLFIPRVISALFGVLAILVSYKLARLLFYKKEVALFSSLLTAASYNLVLISHQARPWSEAVFFSIVAVYWAVKAVKTKNKFPKYVLVSFFFSAVSFGFHQFGAMSALLICLIIFFSELKIKKYIRGLLAGLTFYTMIVFVLNLVSLGSKVFRILDPTNRSDSVELVKLNITDLNSFLNAGKSILNVFFTDPIIILFFVIFALTKYKKHGIHRAFILFFVINILIWVLFFPPLSRYLLISFCFLPVLAGYVFYEFVLRVRYRHLFFVIVMILTFFNSVYFNLVLVQTSTYDLIRQWLDQNIEKSTPLVATSHRYYGYVPNALVIKKVQEMNPGYYGRAAKLSGNTYADNVRDIMYANAISTAGDSKVNYTNKALLISNSRIVIDNYNSSSDRLLELDPKRYRLVAHFSPTGSKIYDTDIPEALFDTTAIFPYFRLIRPGPYIDVLGVID
ncbi:MAG: glycosyltransferase family 39 protein [Patescibacteria group bacterium]